MSASPLRPARRVKDIELSGRSDTRVIILGAGPVGLGAALELARLGVPSLVIERHAATSWLPKTRNFNTRTMEIARGWGLTAYERLRSIDTPPGWKSPIRFLETATGREYGVIESKGFEGPGAHISPAEPVMSSQERMEEILLDACHASPLVEIRFRTEAMRLVKGSGADDDGVALETKDLGAGVVETLNGAALVAADGAASLIRGALAIELQGHRDLSHIVNCYFRAGLEAHLAERKGVLFFISNDKVRGVLQPLDAAGRWLCQISVSAEDWSLDVFTKARAAEWVRAAAGIDDLGVEILSIGLWKLNAAVADQFVRGRVVLCGDAAHQFPPAGGLGVNTGLQGMHNAMWKLAYCIRGEAGWGLLQTYDAERRPVSLRITRQSLQNSVNVARIQAAAAKGADSGFSADEELTASRRYGNHLGVEFGAAYASTAVVPDGSRPPPVGDDYSDYVQSASPGCRAPHVWLGQPAARLSTLDLPGSGFTLLAAPSAQAWCDEAAEARRLLGLRLDIYRIGTAGLQDLGGFAQAYGLDDDGAVLLRPDGHVGWRSVGPPTHRREIQTALRRILALDETT